MKIWKITIKEEKLQKICRKFKLKLVILFGSYASKKGWTEESDIDIGVLCENGKNIIENELPLTKAFIELLGCERIDLIYLNYADPLLLIEVVKNGILLYQDKEDRFAEIKIKAIKRHFNAEKFYKLEDLCLKRFLRKGNDK
jgi:predicted nucleotidyltransferase